MNRISAENRITVIAPRQAHGVTLLEMLMVMTIVGILLAVGIPSYQYVTNSNRIAAEVNGLVGDLQFARSEAIKEGLPVTVCVSTDGATCVAGLGNTAWNTGWIVYSDLNNNGAPDAGEVLRVTSGFPGADTFTTTATSAVIFNREGFATGLAGGAIFTLHATPTNTASTRCVSVTAMGQLATLHNGDTSSAGTCS